MLQDVSNLNCQLHRSNVPKNNRDKKTKGTLHILAMSRYVVTTSPKSMKALEMLLDNDLMFNDDALQMAVAWMLQHYNRV